MNAQSVSDESHNGWLRSGPVSEEDFLQYLNSKVAGRFGPLLRMARNEDLTAQQLDELSKVRDTETRAGVASNPSTPDATLMRLGKSKVERVHEFLESNPRYRRLKGYDPVDTGS